MDLASHWVQSNVFKCLSASNILASATMHPLSKPDGNFLSEQLHPEFSNTNKNGLVDSMQLGGYNDISFALTRPKQNSLLRVLSVRNNFSNTTCNTKRLMRRKSTCAWLPAVTWLFVTQIDIKESKAICWNTSVAIVSFSPKSIQFGIHSLQLKLFCR